VLQRKCLYKKSKGRKWEDRNNCKTKTVNQHVLVASISPKTHTQIKSVNLKQITCM